MRQTACSNESDFSLSGLCHERENNRRELVIGNFHPITGNQEKPRVLGTPVGKLVEEG